MAQRQAVLADLNKKGRKYMCICGGCGKLIDKRFYYCPWCGYSRVETEKEDSNELRYAKFKEKQFQKRYNQLDYNAFILLVFGNYF